MPTDPTLALVFPGQGAQQAGMLEPFRGVAGFDTSCEQVSALLGWDVRRLDLQCAETLSANRASSLLTVLCGVLGLRRLADQPSPAAVAGYSVGQWTALHAAGIIDEATLFSLVARRANWMDEALADAAPSGMLAVIGVARSAIDSVCTGAADAGLLLQLSNDNAPGQVTLAGSLDGLAFAESALATCRPRLLKRLPVAGAWHGSLMAPAVVPLRAALADLQLAPARCAVIDNCSGGWLPADGSASLVEPLAQQVARPVLWQQGIRTLVQSGAGRCLETGWGDVLTRFGFFIDRSVRHEALAPLPRPAG